MTVPWMSWLAYGLAKLQLFTRPGIVIFTLLAATVQVASTLLFASMQISSQFALPVRVIFVMIYVTKGAFYSCSPLSVYLIGKYSPAFLNTKNACVPKYWYLIVLSLMLSLAYNAILSILYWDIYSFVFVIINMALVLLMETVYGIATETFDNSCITFCTETNGNIAENGNILLEKYRILKNTSQLVMFIVIVVWTSHLILMVILKDIELTMYVNLNKRETK